MVQVCSLFIILPSPWCQQRLLAYSRLIQYSAQPYLLIRCPLLFLASDMRQKKLCSFSLQYATITCPWLTIHYVLEWHVTTRPDIASQWICGHWSFALWKMAAVMEHDIDVTSCHCLLPFFRMGGSASGFWVKIWCFERWIAVSKKWEEVCFIVGHHDTWSPKLPCLKRAENKMYPRSLLPFCLLSEPSWYTREFRLWQVPKNAHKTVFKLSNHKLWAPEAPVRN